VYFSINFNNLHRYTKQKLWRSGFNPRKHTTVTNLFPNQIKATNLFPIQTKNLIGKNNHHT